MLRLQARHFLLGRFHARLEFGQMLHLQPPQICQMLLLCCFVQTALGSQFILSSFELLIAYLPRCRSAALASTSEAGPLIDARA